MPSPRQTVWLNRLLGATVLLSAWLLFQVQPMVAKRILPWFGGGSAVWTTTMLFFQTALFAGYLYAHLIAARLNPRSQVLLHTAVLAAATASLILVGVIPADLWKPTGSLRPALHILIILAACVGLPYLALAATAPLVQVWFARANPERSPYRLYSLSNIGSLAALVSYPLVVEPTLGLTRQGLVWSAMFAVFAALCAASGIMARRSTINPANNPQAEPRPKNAPANHEAPTARPSYFYWLALPACASLTLLAVTAFLCQDVAPIPLLWIVPMIVYLLSFILCFDSDRWYRRSVWMPLAAVSSFVAVWIWDVPVNFSLDWRLGVHVALLAGVCMVCHGELARRRPAASYLTAYYLAISAGGALGGLFAGVVAPLVFNDYYELPLGVLAVWVLAIAALVTDRRSPFYDGRHMPALIVMAGLLIALSVIMYRHVERHARAAETIARNFYGVLKVREYLAGQDKAYLNLTNGTTSHGSQYRTDVNRRVPMEYYHPETAVGKALLSLPEGRRNIGVIGLGVGTLAAYAEPGDRFQFYDINPKVIELADYYFTYLRDARERGAKIEIIEGDARLSLERAKPQGFDLLALDAFSSDAIPAHLLTQEAIELYLRHLKDPGGILAIHVTNQHLDLPAVVKASARRLHLDASYLHTEPNRTEGAAGAVWILLCRQPGVLAAKDVGQPLEDATPDTAPLAWTDDYSNLLHILKH